MRLDELKFEPRDPPNTVWEFALVPTLGGNTLYIERLVDGRVSALGVSGWFIELHMGHIKSADEIWNVSGDPQYQELCPLTAQAVLYELLKK